MIYVALLRGVNVGGGNKVSMPQLKSAFEKEGFSSVKTYINSGNVIFEDNSHATEELTRIIETTILNEFGLGIKVVIRNIEAMKATVAALDPSWKNDPTMKCDVMFLWGDVDTEDSLEQLVIKEGIDTVKYIPGAILFVVDRENITKSGLMKLVGSPLYKRMTIRNCNTTRKLLHLMEAIEPVHS